MKYMFLIYENEAKFASLPEHEQHALFGEYMGFTEEMQAKGVLIAGDPLKEVATATTVRVKDGQMLSTDGPFAETREQLGGYYILECQNLDEAMSYAAQIPAAKTGSIEIRPILDVDA
ncbi:YciI family protein [Neptunicella marina]|uniref:YciI family protein n=1 Tax=Neptunicella marina TaxID=2125989 RepID=A0A8J6M4S7_9ALTE|nr:YciI family protein [Neptunicella marina]MBC3766251.1 YciI family protein [Neptunicella marina]